jgi:hypothetical protein
MDSPFAIEIALSGLSQLFESPGPIQSGAKTLHPGVMDAILERAGKAPRKAAFELVLRTSATAVDEAQQVRQDLHDYFAFRGELERQNIRLTLRDGRRALLIGMTFLIVATAVAELIHGTFQGRLMTGVANGLEIFGWVALWYPAELLLYDWTPAYRRMKLLRRLASATIEFRAL